MRRSIIVVVIGLLSLGACSDADVVSDNLSKAADQFEINRRVVFYNGITDSYILVIEGMCSLGNYDKSREVTVVCKVGHDKYKKHFLGVSDNVTFFSEQLEPMPANTYHYRVIFKPSVVVPDIDVR